MEVIKSDRTTFFDCDDTLIMWDIAKYPNLERVNINGRLFGIHDKHVKKIEDYHTMGFTVIVWSTSGHKWAKAVVEALGLTEQVDYVMCKPHRIFDDVKEIKETLKHGYLPLD